MIIKPTSMSKSRGAASKSDRKKALVALRLAMLDQGASVSDLINCPKEELELPSPAPTPPLSTNGIDQSKVSATKRAEEVQSSLSPKHPSFIKHMLHSHIAGGFWLGLPKKFCDLHLPDVDTAMELIDESGEVFNSKYLAAKVGLSAGWRGFSIAHRLEEGDVVVFHLVEKTTFKVYIIRRDTLGETDCAFGLLELDNSNSSSEEQGSEVLDWIRFSEPESASLESFDRFSIQLDGSVSIDAKFPDHIRRKYYSLCRDRSAFLHERLLKGLNCTLVVGIINETINISDAIRAADTGFAESDLLVWDRTLQSFENLGMDVGFLLVKIHGLQGRDLELDEADGLEEAKAEREVSRERVRGLEVKFSELRKQMEVIDNEIEVMMEESTRRKRRKLQGMASSS